MSVADYGNVMAVLGVWTMKSFTPLWDRGGRGLHAIMYLGTRSSLVCVCFLCVMHMYCHCIHNSVSSVSYTWLEHLPSSDQECSSVDMQCNANTNRTSANTNTAQIQLQCKYSCNAYTIRTSANTDTVAMQIQHSGLWV